MINERKVKLMIKMAKYEQNQGKEDEKISEYYRNDYASLHTLFSIFWLTIGYAFLVLLGVLGGMDLFTEKITMSSIVLLVGGVGIGYLVVLVVGGVLSYHFYSTKHQESRVRIKRLNHMLIRLLKMYEKERS